MSLTPEIQDLLFEKADELFGQYVDAMDEGVEDNIRIEWDGREIDGESIDYPEVQIGRVSARAVFKEFLADLEIDLEEEALEHGAEEFNDMMAGIDDAVEYQRGLRSLEEFIAITAITADSGYFDAAQEELASQGVSAGGGETESVAKSLIHQDLQVLADADEAGEAYTECYENNVVTIKDTFEEKLNAYWILVGEDSGEVKAAGGRGTVPTRESHINMEIGFEENLFTYLRPSDEPVEV